MSIVVLGACIGLGVVLVAFGLLLAGMQLLRRLKRGMDVSGDTDYSASLALLSENSAHRNFNPYTDIDWDAPEFAITADDPRWVLSDDDTLGRHPWYKAQPLERQIAIGMWRQANVAKVATQFEGILIRGLVHYTFWVPNGSPEYRYCVHEAIEEGNHTLMFQELVNRIGVNVPGMARWLRVLSPVIPFYAGIVPNSFFFGVLAGEVPFDHLQTNALREDAAIHPALKRIFAIHVAEEARHISFAQEYLNRRIPQVSWVSRLWLSLYVPVVMRMLGQAVVVPPRSFFRTFGVPRSARKGWFFRTPESRQAWRDMFADVRMLCHDMGLMNPAARVMWRLCRIDGPPSRYRNEPRRKQPQAHLTGV